MWHFDPDGGPALCNCTETCLHPPVTQPEPLAEFDPPDPPLPFWLLPVAGLFFVGIVWAATAVFFP